MTTPFTPAMASRIELWPLGRLKPYAKNARTHSDAQVAQIASSIVEYGFTAPLLVSGEGDILAGHGRLAAAQKLAGFKVKNGRWYDCGTLERWERAMQEW